MSADDVLSRAENRVGHTLRGKWRLDRLLGVGGMAAVYSATHRNGSRAAVKVLHPEAALAPGVRQRFLREGYLANKVQHEGAVAILDDDVDEDGTVFLVMELLRGETLESRQHRHGGDRSAATLLQIVDAILACLAAAHEKGIVHRDLKPGNLFITQNGKVKILDFGIARLAAERTPGHTTGAQALGTPGFMPPEQARGRWEEVDARSDLWAVGAVMFAVLTGRYVHEAPTVNEQLLAAMTVPAVPVREEAPDVPEVVARIVDKALSFDKADRWATAEEMRHAIGEAFQALTGAPLTEARGLSVPPAAVPAVDPDAATLDVADLPPGTPLGTTARPVATPKKGLPAYPGRRLAVVLALAVLPLGAAGAYLSQQEGPTPRAEDHAAPGASTSAAAAIAATQDPGGGEEPPESAPAGAAAEDPPPEQGAGERPSPAPDAGTSSGLPVLPARPSASPQLRASPAPRRASPPAPPRPAEPTQEVDLFGRRR
jgi:eukaryotic-like serine/threonine-protein kinase